MKTLQILAAFVLSGLVVWYIATDSRYDPGQCQPCTRQSSAKQVWPDSSSTPVINGALLASRFKSLEALKARTDIEYHKPPEDVTPDEYARVRLRHCSNGLEVSSELETGLSQDDIMNVQKGGIMDKARFLLQSPFAVANRMKLAEVFTLARRMFYKYGEGDVAFYDFAQASVQHITTPELAFLHPGDSGEKGYINTFNHITAQALVTSLFSEEIADFLADVHERKNMPELSSGQFSDEQLANPENNPVDNYVDMINNEWGQEIGKELKKKYNISQNTTWTPALLTDYLNDLQRYYSQAFQIGFRPFKAENEKIIRFTDKINMVLAGENGFL